MSVMNRLKSSLLIAAVAILMAVAAGGRQTEPQFKYAGGTENLPEQCAGLLEMGPDAMVFRCAQYSIAIPYASLTLMQYRPDVSKRVRKLKLTWKVRPVPGGGSKKNRYFTVVYQENGGQHAMVLEVQPLVMRPYLAEIEMRSGRRVEVKGYESYE
jgi:hypothetical protein